MKAPELTGNNPKVNIDVERPRADWNIAKPNKKIEVPTHRNTLDLDKLPDHGVP